MTRFSSRPGVYKARSAWKKNWMNVKNGCNAFPILYHDLSVERVDIWSVNFWSKSCWIYEMHFWTGKKSALIWKLVLLLCRAEHSSALGIYISLLCFVFCILGFGFTLIKNESFRDWRGRSFQQAFLGAQDITWDLNQLLGAGYGWLRQAWIGSKWLGLAWASLG